MTHGYAPFVGFDGIPLHIDADQASGVYPDWVWQPVIEVRHIPGSNRSVVQHMGCPPATIVMHLWFAQDRDYRSFLRKQGVTGRLTLLARFTSAVGVVEHLVNTDYEHLDDVTLIRVSGPTYLAGDQGVECDATFIRAMDPLTGLAVTS